MISRARGKVSLALDLLEPLKVRELYHMEYLSFPAKIHSAIVNEA
jgi:hypothetical protein